MQVLFLENGIASFYTPFGFELVEGVFFGWDILISLLIDEEKEVKGM